MSSSNSWFGAAHDTVSHPSCDCARQGTVSVERAHQYSYTVIKRENHRADCSQDTDRSNISAAFLHSMVRNIRMANPRSADIHNTPRRPVWADSSNGSQPGIVQCISCCRSRLVFAHQGGKMADEHCRVFPCFCGSRRDIWCCDRYDQNADVADSSGCCRLDLAISKPENHNRRLVGSQVREVDSGQPKLRIQGVELRNEIVQGPCGRPALSTHSEFSSHPSPKAATRCQLCFFRRKLTG